MLAVSQFMTHTHGQGKINLELLCALRRRGYSVEAVASWADEDLLHQEQIVLHRVPISRRLPTNWLRGDRFKSKAKSILRTLGEPTINNGAAVIVPSRINIAMFVHGAWHESPWHPRFSGHWHGWYQGLYNRVQARHERNAFSMAGHIVALSDVVKSELIDYCDVNAASISIIPPGVDSERFAPARVNEPNHLRHACGLPESGDDLLVLFVGEIRSSRKNLDLVLSALRELPGIRLAVIGDTHGSRYPALANRLKVADRVYFLGQRSDVDSLMRGADVFVFPTHYEPFGIVVTEAMASGLPVITTRQAGAACVITNETDGYLLDDGADLNGLVERLRSLRDPSLRARMGNKARERACELTWKAMADAYVSLLEPEMSGVAAQDM